MSFAHQPSTLLCLISGFAHAGSERVVQDQISGHRPTGPLHQPGKASRETLPTGVMTAVTLPVPVPIYVTVIMYATV